VTQYDPYDSECKAYRHLHSSTVLRRFGQISHLISPTPPKPSVGHFLIRKGSIIRLHRASKRLDSGEIFIIQLIQVAKPPPRENVSSDAKT